MLGVSDLLFTKIPVKRGGATIFWMEEDRWNHTKVKEGRADFYLPLVIYELSLVIGEDVDD